MLEKLSKSFELKLEAFNNLYVLCDYETLLKRDFTLDKFVELCKSSNVKLLQYRDKVSDLNTQKQNLLYLKQNLDIPIIINDKIELIDYADGIHLGQEDFEKIHKDKKVAIKLIRVKIKDKLLGLSTHNEKEILEANSLDLDMIGLGAYRTTTTKDVNNQLGSKIEYLGKMSIHPVCAIGGVKVNEKIKNVQFNVVGSGFLN